MNCLVPNLLVSLVFKLALYRTYRIYLIDYHGSDCNCYTYVIIPRYFTHINIFNVNIFPDILNLDTRVIPYVCNTFIRASNCFEFFGVHNFKFLLGDHSYNFQARIFDYYSNIKSFNYNFSS